MISKKNSELLPGASYKILILMSLSVDFLFQVYSINSLTIVRSLEEVPTK